VVLAKADLEPCGYCRDNPARQFVVVTESGIIHRLQKECPGKEFLCAPVFDAMRAPTDPCRCSECKFMKMNTLEKVRDCMKCLAPRIELGAEILRRARRPIERMLEISAVPAARASGAPKTSFTGLGEDWEKPSGVDNFSVS
jgi:quinolinate synthase